MRHLNRINGGSSRVIPSTAGSLRAQLARIEGEEAFRISQGECAKCVSRELADRRTFLKEVIATRDSGVQE